MGRRQRSANSEKQDMPLYEHVFLARQDLAQAQVDALAENATKIIEDNGGKVVRTETWGLRNLAYRIAKNRKAHYVAARHRRAGRRRSPSSSARPTSTRTSSAS